MRSAVKELTPEEAAACMRVKKRCQDWLDANPEPKPVSWWQALWWGWSSLLSFGLHEEDLPMSTEPAETLIYRAQCKATIEMVNEVLDTHSEGTR